MCMKPCGAKFFDDEYGSNAMPSAIGTPAGKVEPGSGAKCAPPGLDQLRFSIALRDASPEALRDTSAFV